MVVNDNASFLKVRVEFRLIASKLAPTEDNGANEIACIKKPAFAGFFHSIRLRT
jgi:hypothetical protein